MVFVLAFAIGIIAGLRSFTAPAVISWGSWLTWLALQGTWAAFFGSTVTLAIVSVLALGELVADKLPKTPSRKTPGPFAGRIVLGALSGAALCTAAREPVVAGALLGAVGAVAGTLGGYQARTGLVRALKTPDFVVALIEDAIAVGGGFLIVSLVR